MNITVTGGAGFIGANLGALGSVPRSVAEPVASHHANATGTIEVLEAVRRRGNLHTVVASSSSVYGDSDTLPKTEDLPTRPMSPDRRAGDMRHTQADPMRLLALFPSLEPIPFEDGLRATLAWHRAASVGAGARDEARVA